jgi:Protein of unknown function (DUF4230)
MSKTRLLIVCAACVLLGGLLAFELVKPKPPPAVQEPPVVLRIREAARLETLDVTLYKKIDFAPDPKPPDSVWGSVAQFARYAVRPPRGKAIVFAEAHLSIDLRKLDDQGVRVTGKKVQVVLPRLETKVELRPQDTEIIGSTLDSAETAQLFALAQEAFLKEVSGDAALKEKATLAAKHSLQALLGSLGFWQVEFVDKLPPPPVLQ